MSCPRLQTKLQPPCNIHNELQEKTIIILHKPRGLFVFLVCDNLTPITNSHPVPTGQDAVIPLRIQMEPFSFTLVSFTFVSSTAQT